MTSLEPPKSEPADETSDPADPSRGGPCPVVASKLVFDTEDLEPRHRFDATCAFFDGLFEPRPLADAKEPFMARQVSWVIGGFVVNRALNGPAANTMRKDHVLRDFCAIRYVDRGNYLCVADKGIRRIAPDTLQTGADLDGISTEGYGFYSLEAPRDMIDARHLENGELRLPAIDSPAGRIVLELMSGIFRGLEEGSTAPADRLMGEAGALFDLLTYGSDMAAETGRPEYLQARIAAMERYIDDHLDDPKLGPSHLANKFGFSRAALFRVFEPFGGVATAISRRRMVRAYRILATAAPRRGLVRAVAETCGYSDPNHFSRVFRRHLDLAPGDVARLDRPKGAMSDLSASPSTLRLSRAYR